MKKIGIMVCEKANKVCAGCSCLNAFNGKTHAFKQYEGEEVELGAFFRCSACEEVKINDDKGFLEKALRLKKENIEKVHIGICMEQTNCKKKDDMKKYLEDLGIEVLFGTHTHR